MKFVSALVIPAVMLLVCALLTFSGKATFDDFLEGTRDGISTCVKLLPTLIALLVAVSMLSASGFIDFTVRLISPLMSRLGIPADILPLVLTRPVSGSAATAVFSSLLDRCGPDSFEAFCASVIMGSSETVFYVAGVYFSQTKVKHTGFALPIALCCNVVGSVLACLLCKVM